MLPAYSAVASKEAASATGPKSARTQAVGTCAGNWLLPITQRIRKSDRGEGICREGQPHAICTALAHMAFEGTDQGLAGAAGDAVALPTSLSCWTWAVRPDAENYGALGKIIAEEEVLNAGARN
jgi:hypothetical protein